MEKVEKIMENCVITRLGEIVNNSNMPFMNTLLVHNYGGMDVDTSSLQIKLTVNEPTIVKTTDGSSRITVSGDSYSSYTVPANSEKVITLTDAVYDIIITKLSSIVKFIGLVWHKGTYGFNIEQFADCINLVNLEQTNNSHFTGNIVALADCVNLTTLLFNTSTLSGTLEELVSKMAVNRTLGTLYFRAKGVKFNNSLTDSKAYNITFNSTGATVVVDGVTSTYNKTTDTWIYG